MRLLWESVIRPLFELVRPDGEDAGRRETRVREQLRGIALKKSLRAAAREMETMRVRIAELECDRTLFLEAFRREKAKRERRERHIMHLEGTRSWRYTRVLRAMGLWFRSRRATVDDASDAEGQMTESMPPHDTSQHGEVAAIRALLPADGPRFLVDIGAHDGQLFSNSAPLIGEGWHAILVEPHPLPFAALENRYDGNAVVQCVNVACGKASGLGPLYVGTHANLTENTLCEDENEWFAKHRSNDAMIVPVETLTHILDTHGAPREFPLLLVDAEGMDYDVLLGLDFGRYVPRIIVTEQYRWNPKTHCMKHELLCQNGYTLRALVGCNEVWNRAVSP